MAFKPIASGFFVSGQLKPGDVYEAAAQGFKSIICNRPDDEEGNHLPAALVEEQAKALGLNFAYIPVTSNAITAEDVDTMRAALNEMPAPILAYCRSGARSGKLWEMAQAMHEGQSTTQVYDVVIVGGGSAGIATASSLLKRNHRLSIAVIDPAEDHYYQPGWTMVGAGIFSAEITKRSEKSVMPKGLDWIKKEIGRAHV